jgi:RNA polymerase sigma-70 factor (ECF subfamily)
MLKGAIKYVVNCNVFIMEASYYCMEARGESYYIQRVRSGDREAFTWLVDKYRDMVFTICLRMLGNEMDAAEAAQDAFVKSFRAMDSFQEKSKFSTWLYRITYNECISMIRKRVKVIDLVDEVPEEKETGEELNGMELLSSEERRKYLQQAVETLPETDAVVITLFYYEELSLEEIEEVTGLSNSNIRIKLHRSRKKLQRELRRILKSEVSSIL